MGAERKSQYLEDKDKLATAYHEVNGRTYAGSMSLTRA